MALTSILVHLADDDASDARFDVASELARADGAHVTALYAMPPIGMETIYGLESAPELIETRRKSNRERAEEVEAAFQKRVKQDGLKAEWRCHEGDAAELIMLHARYADLAIVGQRSEESTSATLYYPGIAEEVVLGAGRPVLVVPYIGSSAGVGKRVLVAWNGSREAARALNDALPILERADQVTVLVVDPDGAGRIPGADIAAHLARHGVRTEATHVPSGGLDIGDVLLSRAADFSCDLIVMGAYGHSRIREFVMGGASRHIFDHMTVPVLMAH
jgi:nucleotide-binding universal stress UspA family protein